MAQLIKVLLAEACEEISEVITTELAELDNVRLVGCVKSGDDLMDFILTAKELPDVILMDAQIDIIEHFEVSKQIKAQFPAIKLIALAESDESLYIRKMMEYGADGYILKEACSQSLSDLFEEGLMNIPVQVKFNYTIKDNFPDRSKMDSLLDSQEIQVLKLIMNQYSSMQISEELSMERVEVHQTIDRLHAKTHSENRFELKRYAFRHSIF